MATSVTGRRSARPRVILIGGTSHAGKSSLARELAARLAYEPLSTDKLARHPGRPWPPGEASVPPDVAQHYGALAPEALIGSVLRHYGTMWPMIRALVEARAADSAAPGLVLEGSALWPERAAQLLGGGSVAGLWLVADEALIEARIRRESRFEAADRAGRALIEAFLERTRRYQHRMLEVVVRLGLPRLDVRAGEPIGALADRALDLLGMGGR
jgi:2-phosphoglycerate kinase